MSRQLQVFTRLLPEKIKVLDEIAVELDAEGFDTIKESGEPNVSEVIRILLGRADKRLA